MNKTNSVFARTTEMDKDLLEIKLILPSFYLPWLQRAGLAQCQKNNPFLQNSKLVKISLALRINIYFFLDRFSYMHKNGEL